MFLSHRCFCALFPDFSHVCCCAASVRAFPGTASCRARLWWGGRSLPSPRGARQVSPSRCTARQPAAAGKRWRQRLNQAFSAGPSAEIGGAGGLTGEEDGGSSTAFLQVTLCPISARSRLPAASSPALQRVAPEHRPAPVGRGRGRGRPGPGRRSGRPLLWLPFCPLVSPRVPAARGHEIRLKSGFLCIRAIAFRPPPTFFFSFSFFLREVCWRSSGSF